MYQSDNDDHYSESDRDAYSPREYTPTSEVGILWKQYKLVTAGGQSNYYTVDDKQLKPESIPGAALPCVEFKDKLPDGAKDSGEDSLITGCHVCNSTHPCLFDLSQDHNETTNLLTASVPNNTSKR